ncbi:TMP2L-like protein [Mya arenaria]|uniref:TMP2L-like protein n=1 Tax=Mya arenaria TaxID=6604 RepID=A0ABY7FNE8_MYAAR|nr:TMP2L-like protein [Mya arenaria]
MPEHSTLSRPGPPVKRISGLSVASLHTGPSRTLSGISGRVGHNDLSTPASVSRGTVVTIPTEELHMAEETHGQGYKNAKIPYQEMSSKDRKYMTELRQFIRQHFHILECNRFVPAPGQGGKKIRAVKCKCGGVLTEHAGISQAKIVKKQTVDLTNIAEMAIVPPELRPYFRREKLDDICPEKFPMLKWGEEAFRKTVTNTFGKIDFVNVEHKGGKKPAKYIRLCADSAVEDVFNLMQDYWKIMEPQAPNLVISVVGGAKNFKLDGRNRTTFSDGLIKTAKTTSAWLISSGFNMGVMKAVGQAVQQGQSFAWDNNRMAHRLRCIGIAPWGYIRDRKCLVETNSGQGQFYAKYRTSNVILHGEPVPLNADHTHFIFVDDGYRNRYGGVAEMRSKIEQRISAPKSDGGLEIPVVLIVVEGGIDAIEDAKSSVQHDIPVVVCSGTGRAADILAYAYTHTKTSSSGEREMSDKHLKKLREKIIDAYGKAWKAMEKETKFTGIKDSVQICCKNPDLMTVFNMNKHDELDLAILSVLLKKNSGADKHVGDTNQRLNQLRLALTWNRVDIAQEEIFREDVLWEQGSLDQVLTEAIVDDKVAFLKLILEQGIIFKEFLTMDRLNILYSKVPKFHPIFKLLHKLTGLQDLAKFCWEMGDEPVTSAIAVTRLYGAMARHITRDESNVRDMFHQYKIEFELLATDVLEECHQSDPDKAMMIVERRSPVWGEMTSLQIAAASNDQFITFPAPTLMSKLRDWYGMVNYLEALNYLLYILAFILHLLDFYQASKVLYCINSVVFILFLTKFYTASTSIGPKMLGELQLFIFVVLVFLLAYGIAAQGLLYSERSPSWTILRDVFYYPYWQLYGELFFDAIGDDGDGCDSDQSMGKCIQGDRDCLTYHWMVPFILAAYLMIGNILLLNLLIAIFSNVFHTVEKNSFEIWKFQMYYLVMEYNQKTFLAQPLSIFCHAALALKWLYELVCCKLKHEEQFLGRKHLEWLQIFEKEMMANYLRLRRAADQNSLDTRVQQLEKRVDMLTKLIEDEVIQDQQPELPPELTFVAGSYNSWPSTLDVMAVSVAEGATDGSLKNLSSTHPGPKPQAQLLRLKSVYQLIHKPTSPVLSRMKSAPNLLHGQSEKEREHIDEPVKEVKGDVLDLDKEKDDTMKDIDNDKNVGAIGGMELTEKELEKIRKKEEKELRRKKRQERKEEKRKKKEMKEINDKFDNEMNDVNRPGNTNKPDRQVTFDLDEEEAERSRPMTAPEMFRSIEIDEQENIADNSGRFEHRSAW